MKAIKTLILGIALMIPVSSFAEEAKLPVKEEVKKEEVKKEEPKKEEVKKEEGKGVKESKSK